MAKKKSELFEALNCINVKTKPTFDVSKISGYLLSLWLAQDRSLISYTQKINPYIFQLSNETVFWYYFKTIPKKKRFIKWTKKNEVHQSDELKELMLKFNISEIEARMSLDL